MKKNLYTTVWSVLFIASMIAWFLLAIAALYTKSTLVLVMFSVATVIHVLSYYALKNRLNP